MVPAADFRLGLVESGCGAVARVLEEVIVACGRFPVVLKLSCSQTSNPMRVQRVLPGLKLLHGQPVVFAHLFQTD